MSVGGQGDKDFFQWLGGSLALPQVVGLLK